jgi:hypothetical protein
MNIPEDLLPGDILECAGDSVVRSYLNSDTGHTATYAGVVSGIPSVVTSLTETGVGLYPLTQGAQNIVHIRRPSWKFDIDKAMASFESNYKGKPYGWGDCANDVGLPDFGGGWNCSHTSSQFLEDGGCPQFDLLFPKSKITPRDMSTSLMSAKIF